MEGKAIACFCIFEGQKFGWVVRFNLEKASFYYCVCVAVFCACFDVKRKKDQAIWVNLVQTCLEDVRNFIKKENLNESVFFEFAKVFQTMLLENNPSHAFSFLRFYLESSSSDVAVAFEYCIRFILARHFTKNQSQILNEDSVEYWKSFLNYISKKLFLKFVIIENSDKLIIEKKPERTISKSYILKENTRFSFLFKNRYFLNLDGVYEMNQALWRFNYFTNSWTIPQEDDNIPNSTSRSSIIIQEKDQVTCHKRKFLEIFMFIINKLQIPAPNKNDINNYFSGQNIEKYINSKKIFYFFKYFFPDIRYNTEMLIELINDIHIPFDTPCLSQKTIRKLLRKSGIDSNSGDLQKITFIEALVVFIKWVIKRKIYST